MMSWKFIFCLTTITLVYSGHCAGTEPKYLHSKGSTVLTQNGGKGEKVDVKLYYESLCPGCVMFHRGALNQTVAAIGAYLDLKTYPYGNAERSEENGTVTIECQHGPDECYGNKLHACAIDILKNVTRSVYYVSCMMGGSSTDKDATDCGKLMNIDAKPIIECAKGKKGEELLEYYGKETDKTNHEWTPWILINGELFKDAPGHFMPKVCSLLAHPPPECKK